MTRSTQEGVEAYKELVDELQVPAVECLLYNKGMLYDFASLAGSLSFILIFVLVAIFAFEIAMLVHVIRNKNIADNVRILWIVGMLLIHPFVAVAYYFTDYNKA